jgi:hypothetical protein
MRLVQLQSEDLEWRTILDDFQSVQQLLLIILLQILHKSNIKRGIIKLEVRRELCHSNLFAYRSVPGILQG